MTGVAQRRIRVKGKEYAGSRKDPPAVTDAKNDGFVRDYASTSEMKQHLVSRKPVQVGLIRPLALWYRLPLLNKKFMVLGESHNAVTATHIQDESGLKKSLLYEAAPGWNVDETATLSREKKPGGTEGLDENSSKLLRAIELFLGISQAPIGGLAADVTPNEIPSRGGGKRRAADGSYKLLIPNDTGDHDAWVAPKSGGDASHAVGNFNAADQAFAAIEALLPKFVSLDDGFAFDNVLPPKDAIAYNKALQDLRDDPPRNSADAGQRLKKMRAICRGLLPAVQHIAAGEYARMVLPKKHKATKATVRDHPTADDYRDEYMLHRIVLAAKSKKYMLAGLGDQHLRHIAPRLTAAGIPSVSMADFYSTYSQTAVDVAAAVPDGATQLRAYTPGAPRGKPVQRRSEARLASTPRLAAETQRRAALFGAAVVQRRNWGKTALNILSFGLRKALVAHKRRQQATNNVVTRPPEPEPPVEQVRQPDPLDRFVEAYGKARYYHQTGFLSNLTSIEQHGLLNYQDRLGTFGHDIPGMSAVGGEFKGDEKKGVFIGPKKFMRGEGMTTPVARAYLGASRTKVHDWRATDVPSQELVQDPKFRGGAVITKDSIPSGQVTAKSMEELLANDDPKLDTILDQVATHFDPEQGPVPGITEMKKLLATAVRNRRLSNAAFDV